MPHAVKAQEVCDARGEVLIEVRAFFLAGLAGDGWPEFIHLPHADRLNGQVADGGAVMFNVVEVGVVEVIAPEKLADGAVIGAGDLVAEVVQCGFSF